MIKTKRKINKAMLVANVIPMVMTNGWSRSILFHSLKHNDYLAVPSPTVIKGWKEYGYMANQYGMGGRSNWQNDGDYLKRAGLKRVSTNF